MYVTITGKSIKQQLFHTARAWKTKLENNIKAGIDSVSNPLFQKFEDNKWFLQTAIYGRVYERINHPTSLKLYLVDHWSKLDKKNCSATYKNSVSFATELDYVVNYVFLNYYPYRNKRVAEPNKQLKYIEQRKEELQHWMRTAKPSWLLEPIRALAKRISSELGFSLSTLYKPQYLLYWHPSYKAVRNTIEKEYDHNQDKKIGSKPLNPMCFFTSLRRVGKHLGLPTNLKKEVLAAFGLYDLEQKRPTQEAFNTGRCREVDYRVKSKNGQSFVVKTLKWLVEDLFDQEFTYPAEVWS